MPMLMKAKLDGLYWGQTFNNILWYITDADPGGVDAQYEQDAFAAVFFTQVIDDLQAVLPTEFVFRDSPCQIYNMGVSPLTIQPTMSEAIADTGQITLAQLPPFVCGIVRANLVDAPYITTPLLDRPKRGHWRVGPLTEAWVNNDGTFSTQGLADMQVWADQYSKSVQNGPATALVWFPVKLGTAADGNPDGIALINGATVRRETSTCRSRRANPYGG